MKQKTSLALSLSFATLFFSADLFGQCDTVYHTQGKGGKISFFYVKTRTDTAQVDKSGFSARFQSGLFVLDRMEIEDCAQPEQLDAILLHLRSASKDRSQLNLTGKTNMGIVVTYKKTFTLQDIVRLANAQLLTAQVYVDLPKNELIIFVRI